MKFIILRQLTHSELGVFHSYRRLGKEGSKQRAINFDWDVVDRVFPAAKDSDQIDIDCRYYEEAGKVSEIGQWLKKQDKNWRFEGNLPKSDYYDFVDPDVLFVMSVDATRRPAKASWIVIPLDHPARIEILNHGECSRLMKSPMIALYDDEGAHTNKVIAKHFPELFGTSEKAKPITMIVDEDNSPDPEGTFEILGRTGHSLHSAVADLIDNSISANATEIHIAFPDPNINGYWMCIRDNGTGMTAEKLQLAMKVGKRKEYESNDLGKFGYGLKGASWSQADCLTVVTKAKVHEQINAIWDKEHLIAVKKWEMPRRPIPVEFVDVTTIPDTGTAILLTKIRPGLKSEARGQLTDYQAKCVKIKNHVELVFHRFLEGNAKGRARVRIWLNDTELVASNPMEHALSKDCGIKEVQLPGVDDAKIYIQAHIIPNESEIKAFYADKSPVEEKAAATRMSANRNKNDSQGVYFYRLDRLIKWGGWNGIYETNEPHARLLRMSLYFDRDIEDYLKVDISKQMVELPPSLGIHINNYLKPFKAEAIRRYRGEESQKGKSKKLTPPPAGESNGTPTDGTPAAPTAPTGGKKNKPTKGVASPIRLVESGKLPWTRGGWANADQVEISPVIPELVALAKAIDDNHPAKEALSKFLLVLESKDLVKHLTDD